MTDAQRYLQAYDEQLRTDAETPEQSPSLSSGRCGWSPSRVAEASSPTATWPAPTQSDRGLGRQALEHYRQRPTSTGSSGRPAATITPRACTTRWPERLRARTSRSRS